MKTHLWGNMEDIILNVKGEARPHAPTYLKWQSIPCDTFNKSPTNQYFGETKF